MLSSFIFIPCVAIENNLYLNVFNSNFFYLLKILFVCIILKGESKHILHVLFILYFMLFLIGVIFCFFFLHFILCKWHRLVTDIPATTGARFGEFLFFTCHIQTFQYVRSLDKISRISHFETSSYNFSYFFILLRINVTVTCSTKEIMVVFPSKVKTIGIYCATHRIGIA